MIHPRGPGVVGDLADNMGHPRIDFLIGPGIFFSPGFQISDTVSTENGGFMQEREKVFTRLTLLMIKDWDAFQ
ncbi:MAG: hypothetical protein KKE17_12930, partial [Proteobacteria bacterium]|nr:hypothetical protein [Pseudomonadota bacterium]MBU1710900.1 hypothetical protein [Pseudomonadota bacterium]